MARSFTISFAPLALSSRRPRRLVRIRTRPGHHVGGIVGCTGCIADWEHREVSP